MSKNIFYELAEKYESGEWNWCKDYSRFMGEDGKFNCCITGGIAELEPILDRITYNLFLYKYFTGPLLAWQWNDRPERTKEEVISILKKAGDLWEANHG